MSIAAVGLALLSRFRSTARTPAICFPGCSRCRLAWGLTFVPLTLIATTNVKAEDAGLASGLLNTSQQLGGALGLAVLSTLAANTTSTTLAAIAGTPSGADRVSALVSGFHVAFLIGAFLFVAGAILLAALVRPRADVASIEAVASPALAPRRARTRALHNRRSARTERRGCGT